MSQVRNHLLRQLDRFGRIAGAIDRDAFLESTEKVEVFIQIASPFIPVEVDWKDVESANTMSAWGVIWRDVDPELFGFDIPTIGSWIFGREEEYSFAVVSSSYSIISNNGTSAGYREDINDFVTLIETGEVCPDHLSWQGFYQVPFSWNSEKGGYVSDCYFLRDAKTNKQITLLEASAIVGAEVNATESFWDDLNPLSIRQIIRFDDINYKEGGILTPVALIDSGLQFTAKTLDIPSTALFDVELFTPLYTFIRGVIMYLAFIALCLFCLSIVWHVANR